MPTQSEYAQSGVNYASISPFKEIMKKIGEKTLAFPNSRGVYVTRFAHSASFNFIHRQTQHRFFQTTEGLGNKNWIAEWMYQNAGTGQTYYDGIGIDTALMAVNDLIAHGAMPVGYTDEVAAGDSEWFEDENRARALAASFYGVCQDVGMALVQGESPALRYLIRAEPPVKSAPSLSGSVTGIAVADSRYGFRHRIITGEKLSADDRIVAVSASGIHANGISLIIKRALALKEKFLTKLPNGRTLGEEALIPTRSYVRLVEELLNAHIPIHKFLPGTGGGVAKLASDSRPFTYRIHSWWEEIPPLFKFMRELGVSIEDCLTTFNWGSGYYFFVPANDVDEAIKIASRSGYEAMEVGFVEEGDRQVVFEPYGLVLPPPGD